jgi:regulator of sirC expression with transglutaminase-like and TPR domain
MEQALNVLNGLAPLPDDSIDLLRGALAVSQLYQPGLDVDRYRRHLESLATAAVSAVPHAASLAQRVAALNRFLFDREGFSGNMDDYYDPRNSFLDQVLDRRLGIPISLSILYLEIARRVGIPAFGVGFPGHFLVRVGEGTSAFLVDPFAAGESLDESELDRRLAEVFGEGLVTVGEHPAVLRIASKREILVRILANLKGVFSRKSELENALVAMTGILTLIPDSAENLRDRGLIYRDLGYVTAAVADLRRYVSIAGNAEEIAALTPLIEELASQQVRLH